MKQPAGYTKFDKRLIQIYIYIYIIIYILSSDNYKLNDDNGCIPLPPWYSYFWSMSHYTMYSLLITGLHTLTNYGQN